jgi:competence protein ComEA
MRQLIKEYFSFTKKERIAIIGLVVLVLAAYLLPYFIKPPGRTPSAKEVEEFRKLEVQLALAKRNDNGSNDNDDGYSGVGDNNETKEHYHPPERLFYFDPNTISADGWKQLGLRSKTIGTILNYLSKGGRFYEAVDLKKIYGLRPQEYARLERYIRIGKPPPGTGKFSGVRNFSNQHREPSMWRQTSEDANFHAPGNATASNRHLPSRASPSAKDPIDINLADTLAWISLPGIGSKLAARIVAFRQKLGGFYAIEQVRETYGLPDSTFQNILPVLTKSSYPVKKINLNNADFETLKQHPYIRWNIATAIVRYREQHGAFTSVEALLQIAVVTPEVYRKVLPYVTITGD